MFIHGIRPGPTIMLEQPEFVFGVVVMLLFATLAITFYGLALTRLFVLTLKVPRERLMGVVFVLCVIGPFAITQRLFDVWVMVAFGILGYVMRRMRYPMAPLVLGIILGDLLDKSLRRGLIVSDGSLEPFLTRPISAVLAAACLLTIAMSVPAVRDAARAAARMGLTGLGGRRPRP
jgi:putative tricarboxylic transport membrane protein